MSIFSRKTFPQLMTFRQIGCLHHVAEGAQACERCGATAEQIEVNHEIQDAIRGSEQLSAICSDYDCWYLPEGDA